MKKHLAIFAFVCTLMLPNFLVAQTLSYNNNRIACSADGNTQPNVVSTHKNITYQGRVGEKSGVKEIYWSGTSIKINFEGTSVKAILNDEHGTNYFNIIIDGKPSEILQLKKGKFEYVLGENLALGKHSIEITKRNEWTYGTTRFYGFKIEGKLLEKDAGKNLFIEFYGDSITAGHGNEDYSGEDKSDGSVTNNYNTYAAITARTFDADYTCIARGGIGIMVSWFNMIMPEMYDRLNPNNENSQWDFSKKQPDIVVVNLFQNDSWIVNLPENDEFKRRFGTKKPTENETIEAYLNFIKTIRVKYPKTAIVCILGNMDITKEQSPWPGYVQKAVDSLKDENIFTSFVPFKNTKGHPKVNEHQLIANKLIETINTKILK